VRWVCVVNDCGRGRWRLWDHVETETVTLWRPTGPEELALVKASKWPPRLPE